MKGKERSVLSDGGDPDLRLGLKQEEIAHDPKKNIFADAFASELFRKRVLFGIERLQQLRAESGFEIVSDGKRIVYSPVTLGTSDSRDDNSLFHMAGNEIFTESSLDDINVSKDFSILGSFHFHPVEAPFSNEDIEYSDEMRYSSGLKAKPDFFMGVFIPSWESNRLRSMRLFMFQGPPIGTDYQGTNFDEASLRIQRDVLKKSGMKTILVVFPRRKDGNIDLELLARSIDRTYKK